MKDRMQRFDSLILHSALLQNRIPSQKTRMFKAFSIIFVQRLIAVFYSFLFNILNVFFGVYTKYFNNNYRFQEEAELMCRKNVLTARIIVFCIGKGLYGAEHYKVQRCLKSNQILMLVTHNSFIFFFNIFHYAREN